MSPDGRIWGCYIHGLFGNETLRRAWLTSLGWDRDSESIHEDPFAASLTYLADTVESELDMDLIMKLIEEAHHKKQKVQPPPDLEALEG
jgi:adenosylcobyric acid synthase